MDPALEELSRSSLLHLQKSFHSYLHGVRLLLEGVKLRRIELPLSSSANLHRISHDMLECLQLKINLIFDHELEEFEAGFQHIRQTLLQIEESWQVTEAPVFFEDIPLKQVSKVEPSTNYEDSTTNMRKSSAPAKPWFPNKLSNSKKVK